ncbi:hypothetical protein MHBO_000544 [Bonamia ostreae]|uniref:PH domain-containing protein n=1 Tax=Bonamia ostreae TaxID=126728 RepID=A0ABV2AGL7_9EUKA
MSLTDRSNEVNYFFEKNKIIRTEKTKIAVRQSVFKFLLQGVVLKVPRKILPNKRYVFCLRRVDRNQAAIYFYPEGAWNKINKIPLTDIVAVEGYETRKWEKNRLCFKIMTPDDKYKFICSSQKEKGMLTAAIRFLICEKIVRRSSVNRIPKHKLVLKMTFQ